jgi:hypothetical protein
MYQGNIFLTSTRDCIRIVSLLVLTLSFDNSTTTVFSSERSSFFPATRNHRQGVCRMPRYFFDVVEGNDSNSVTKDAEGIVLPGVHAARKEAVGFARGIAQHRFRNANQKWKVVVTDENGTQVLTVPLSKIRGRSLVWLELRHRIAALEANFGPRTLACLIAAAVIGIVVQSSVRRELVTKESGSYQTASIPTGVTIVAMRFAPQASAADITKFLDAYNASLIGGSRPAGFYRLRIGEVALPPEELAELVGRMGREKVVEYAVAVQ